jgi:hypothetical protein
VLKSPAFKIYLPLVFKSTALQAKLELEFHCIQYTSAGKIILKMLIPLGDPSNNEKSSYSSHKDGKMPGTKPLTTILLCDTG